MTAAAIPAPSAIETTTKRDAKAIASRFAAKPAAVEQLPLPPAPPRRPTVRKLFSFTKRYSTPPLLLAESRRQYPEAIAIYAHSTTVDAFGLTGVQADDRVPKGLVECEVYL